MKKYKGKHLRSTGKPAALIAALVVLICCAVGGTIAFIIAQTHPVTNTFEPASVSAQVTEKFENNVKTDVNAVNTSNIDAYLRIRLVSYRVNEDGEHIGGTAEIPAFTLGEGWFEQDGIYYYSRPVAPNESPATNLAESITLVEYEDADGGRQVIEVMAEAIQATPAGAAAEAWHVSVNPDGTLSKGAAS